MTRQEELEQMSTNTKIVAGIMNKIDQARLDKLNNGTSTATVKLLREVKLTTKGKFDE